MARLIIMLMVALAAASTYATTIHVPADQPTIQEGINAAVTGDTVLVAPGTYSEQVVFAGRSVVLLSSGGSENTILSTSTGGVVFPSGQGNSSIVKGFTIRDAINASGIRINTGNSPSILACTLISNSGVENGGGIYCGGQGVTIGNCRFVGNAGNEGGGLAVDYATDVTIDSCVFISNTATSGASIYVRTATNVMISRCVSWHNSAGAYGGFMYACNHSPNLTILNNTIVSNTSSLRAAGITLWDCPSADIRNNIVAYNQGACGVFVAYTADPSLEYNDVYANPFGNYSGVLAGTGSISADPLLADTAQTDFRLLSGSPCLDAGDPAPQYNDADGSRNDIGALGPAHIPCTIRVPADQPTIQAGIDAAWSGDTVLVANGTYTGDGNHDIDLRGKAILVKSENGSANTIIDCGSGHEPPWHGFVFRSGEGDNCVLDGFTVSNDDLHLDGRTLFNGGGVTVEDAAPVIRNCVFEYGGRGSTVCIRSSPMFISCAFRFNQSGWYGAKNATTAQFDSMFGSVQIHENSNPAFYNCVFDSNFAQGIGAAAVVTASHSGFTKCVFRDNRVEGSWDGLLGGALYTESSVVSIDSCLFESNHSRDGGGAIYACAASDLTLIECTLRTNNAYSGAGAIQCDSSSILLNACILDGNSSGVPYPNPSGNGGGIGLHGGNADISGSTFVNNLAPYNEDYQYGGLGAAIEVHRAQLAVTGSLFAGNEGIDVIHCDSSATATITCSNIFGNTAGEWVGCIADQLGQNGNISLDPLFCDTANGNYALFNFSPCAAANNSCGQTMGAYDVGCTLAASLALPNELSAVHVVSHAPEVAWTFGPNPGWQQTEFELEVGTDNDWGVAEMWDPAVVQSSEHQTVYAGQPLLDGVTYYARVKTLLNGSWTPWYETSFRMNSLPVKPTVASPHNGSFTGYQPTLYVNNSIDPEGDSLAYQFAVFHDPNELTPVATSDLIPQQADSTGWTVEAILTENEIYLWRCRAWDGYEYSDWSTYWFFAVNSFPEPPGTPTVTAPVGEDLILYDMLPTFSWTKVSDPDPLDEVKYRLELSLTPGFSMVMAVDNLADTSYYLPDSLSFNTRYWWRVKALDKGGLTAVSTPADFWTWTLGDVNHTHDCTIGDISLMIDHLFLSGIPIVPPKVGDVNASCDITIGDISMMIDHLFLEGTPFLVGCE